MEESMKKLLPVCLLILVLSFPIFAGHTMPGGAYCDCGAAGCVEDYPGQCGDGYRPMAAHQTDAPNYATAELGIAIVALLLWLRLKA
jgi:hypothetical protein